MFYNIHIPLRKPQQMFDKIITDQIIEISDRQSVIGTGDYHHIEALVGPDQRIGQPQRGLRMDILVQFPVYEQERSPET